MNADHDFDRYRRAGLVANPFAAGPPDPDADDVRIDSWFVDRGLPDPPAPGSATLIQVIGDQGLGKSTHIARWRGLQPGPRLYIPRRPYRQRWSSPPVADLVYGDEIDRMPVALRRRWFRHLAAINATVVVGTHRDLSKLARRVGLAVRTHHLALATHEELAAVLQRRLAAATLDGRSPTVAFTDADVAAILQASGGNLREADSVAHRLLAERVGQASGSTMGADFSGWPD